MTNASHSAAGPTSNAASKWTAGEIALLVAPFAILWAAYIGLRSSMPDDALAPFRNGLYWPDGEALMLAKGGGLLTRILLHVGFTYGLGILFVVAFVVVRSVVSKSESRSRVGVFVCFGLAFLVMLGVSTVPNRAMRITDSRIVVAHMIPVPPWTTSTEELAVADVRALGARLGVRGTKSKERVVRLFALPREGEPLELGEAECPGSDDACLEWADPAVAQLAKAIGWKGKLRVSMTEGGELRQFKPATEQ